MPCPASQGAQGAGCYAPPRRRASQTAIHSQPSRSQRSVRPIIDYFVTEVQATITASATCSHSEGHRSDLSPIFICGRLRVSDACQGGADERGGLHHGHRRAPVKPVTEPDEDETSGVGGASGVEHALAYKIAPCLSESLQGGQSTTFETPSSGLHKAWRMSSISPRIIPQCPGCLSNDTIRIQSTSQGEKPEEGSYHIWHRCSAWWRAPLDDWRASMQRWQCLRRCSTG
jgi:hypothetical protein